MQAEVAEEGAALGWRATLRSYAHPKVIALFFLGFSAGLPLLLIFSSLSIWLTEAGVERAAVTLLSWAGLAYSFKFVWAPLVDKLPLPLLTRWLGRRRAWLLLAQLGVMAAIVWMALTDPQAHLLPMALAAVALGFASATQDIVIDAYRIEAAPPRLQGLMAASYIAGYRVGMLAAGAGALKLAAAFALEGAGYEYSAWRDAYLWMSALMLVGVVTTLLIREPEGEPEVMRPLHSLESYVRFLGLFLLVVATFVAAFIGLGSMGDTFKGGLAGWLGSGLSGFLVELLRLLGALVLALGAARLAVTLGVAQPALLRETYIAPVTDFFYRYRRYALLILLLIGCYRVSDIVLGVISNVFYTDMGYDKDQIADIAKTFGLLMTLVGGFIGGGMALRFGVMRMLLLGAVLAAATNLLFVLLAVREPDTLLLAWVIGVDSFSAGLASAAFVAYLSGLTNISFTAFQYAVFSSLMTLFPKLFGGYSGALVDTMGYSNFFIVTALMGLPVILLVWLVGRRAELRV